MLFSRPIRSRLIRHALLAISMNAAIAITLTAFGQESFGMNMLYSQLIGLSIWTLIDGGRHLLHPHGHLGTQQAVILTLVGSVVGYFFGSALGDFLLGHDILIGWQQTPSQMAGFLLLSLVAGCALVYFFMSREILMQERSERALAQRQATEAQLKLLQSQLDPHMLFNTLANLRSLIPEDPQRATEMLDQLSDFLRATLSASRAPEHSLEAEFDRLHDYLALMQVRMGPRLHYELDLPPTLAAIAVPTLILQSLVENAIVHGLEPKVSGGTVRVSACERAGELVLEVRDDGLGCASSDELHSGFGLKQVRERLAARYGAHAALDFIAVSIDPIRAEGQKVFIDEAPNDPALSATGCQVILRLPLPSVT